MTTIMERERYALICDECGKLAAIVWVPQDLDPSDFATLCPPCIRNEIS